MKKKFFNVVLSILKKLAQLTVKKYHPAVIAITGSVGKTSAKVATAYVLGKGRDIRMSLGNFNSEIGVVLTILGDWDAEDLKLLSREYPPGTNTFKKIRFLLKVLYHGMSGLIKRAAYPELLILEYGVDAPGDMSRLVEIARPDVSVMTALGDIPAHVEFFSTPGELMHEKARIIERLPRSGFAILNYDDENVMDAERRTQAQVMTFGFSKGADVRIANFSYSVKGGRPAGVSFRIEYGGNYIPLDIEGVYGKVQAYAVAAAAAIGLILGMNMATIGEALGSYKPLVGRGGIIRGIKDTYIIDDTYNASPLSVEAALDALKKLPGKRKIAVLGDMLELGKYTLEAHEGIGEIVAETADILFTVGPRAKFIAESARANGLKEKNVMSFDTADEAGIPLQNIMQQGDLVLIKGSHAVHLEKIIEEVKDIKGPIV